MTNLDSFKLSVIIPAYNSSQYIEETLKSVLSQTSPAYEIIVIDDGSTDNTAEIVSRYPVKLIKKTNEGPSKTRNRGIFESTGNWVAFLDSDDLWHEDKIASIKSIIEKNPNTGMLSTGFFIGNPKDGWQNIASRKLFDPDGSFFRQVYRRSFIATSSVVIKKEVLDKVGGFDSTLLIAEDLDLWLRIALNRTNYHYLKERLLYYRVHDSSITSNPLNAHGDSEKVFTRYCIEAGFKLFTTRMIVWNLTTSLSLWRQGKYFLMICCLFKLPVNIIRSPFIYIKQLQNQVK